VRLASRRLPEGLAGIGDFHHLLAGHTENPTTWFGTETDGGLWVEALVAAGYQVYAINPLAAARYRDRHHVSGPNPTPGMPNSWPMCSVPTGTTIAESPVTPWAPRRSKCWLGHIRI
jgi:hypothetical protein